MAEQKKAKNDAELKNLTEIRKLIAEFTEALVIAEEEKEKAA